MIIRWFNRLKEEYPDIDLHHTVLNEIYPKVLNLYGDDSFMPVFGKPFDAMSADDRNYVKQLIRRLFMGPRPEICSMVSVTSWNVRLYSRRQLFLCRCGAASRLSPLRIQEMATKKTRLKALPPTSVGFDEILALKQAGKESFPGFMAVAIQAV